MQHRTLETVLTAVAETVFTVGMSTTSTRRTYKIVPVSEILPGDIIKISRAKVADVQVHGEVTTLTFTTGRTGQVFSAERHGVYRPVAPR